MDVMSYVGRSSNDKNIITVLTNSDIKYIKSLSQQKFRQKYNKFIAEGDKICSELLNAGNYKITQVYCTNEWYENQVTRLDKFKKLITVITKKDLSRISQLRTPNQVLMILEKPMLELEVTEVGDNTIIYLDEVQDPGNVGTIIRIADWYGIKHVVRSYGTADFYSPKVIQATMASFANVGLYSHSFEDVISVLSDHESVGAVLGGMSIEQLDWPQRSIIVMGNESKGITPDVLTQLNHSIMLSGSKDRLADSLNVGIATALMCQKWWVR